MKQLTILALICTIAPSTLWGGEIHITNKSKTPIILWLEHGSAAAVKHYKDPNYDLSYGPYAESIDVKKIWDFPQSREVIDPKEGLREVIDPMETIEVVLRQEIVCFYLATPKSQVKTDALGHPYTTKHVTTFSLVPFSGKIELTYNDSYHIQVTQVECFIKRPHNPRYCDPISTVCCHDEDPIEVIELKKYVSEHTFLPPVKPQIIGQKFYTPFCPPS